MSQTLKQIAKFGAVVTAGYRPIFLKVTGNSLTWQNQGEAGIQNALEDNNIGVESIHEIWSISGAFYHEYEVTVIALQSQSDSEVMSLVRQALSSVLSGINVSVIASDSAADWSLKDIVPTSTAGVAGLSVGMMVAIGLGFVALMSLRTSNLATSYRRSFR